MLQFQYHIVVVADNTFLKAHVFMFVSQFNKIYFAMKYPMLLVNPEVYFKI